MARTKELTPREKEFAKEYALTGNSYQSALKVGYDETTAKNKAYKWVDEGWKGKKGFKPLLFQEVERLKEEKTKIINKELSYKLEDHYNELCNVQNLAMLPDEKGNYKNLPTAEKCIEAKGRLFGLYEKDNMQKADGGIRKIYITNEEKKIAEKHIDDFIA